MLNELALFAGAGGGILGGHLLGWRTVCAVEFDAYARSVLIARQNDGTLAPFPIWDDVRTFDGRAWRGIVDVVSGGFPCQDVSLAGSGKGVENGAKSGLWREMARIVGEVRPRFVFVENVPALTRRGLGIVLGDLATMGFDARWGVVGARHAGAPHRRDRMWIVAETTDADSDRGSVQDPGDAEPWHHGSEESVADADSGRQQKLRLKNVPGLEGPRGHEPDRCGAANERQGARRLTDWWETEPDVGRVAHGVAARVDRLRCIGNGQVPAVAALAWKMIRGSKP
jgi:DNA (cytosine-5)-methyltransferase 1